MEGLFIFLIRKYKDNPEYFVNGEFQANLLSETEKAQIRDLTAGIGAVIGGAVGDSSYNAQLAGVIGQNAVENNIDSPKDYQNAKAYSEQLYKDACAAYGLSGAACNAQIRKDGYEILKGTALVLLPTEPYELIPVGKGVGILIKGTKKLKAVFKNAEEAQKAADKAKVKVENNIHRDDDLLNTPNGAKQYWGESLSKVTRPADRHLFSRITNKGKLANQNTIIDNKIVDVNADVQAIRNGTAKVIDKNHIEVNGRIYKKHDKDDFKLIPVSGPGVYPADKITYKFLGEIVKQNGNINKTREFMSKSKDFNAKDFDKAVRLYNTIMSNR